MEENVFEEVSVNNDFEGFGDFEDIDSEYELDGRYTSVIENYGEGYKKELDELEQTIVDSYGVYSQDLVQRILDEDRIDLLGEYKESLSEIDKRTLEYFLDRYNQDDLNIEEPMRNEWKDDIQGENKSKHGKRVKFKGSLGNLIDSYQYAA